MNKHLKKLAQRYDVTLRKYLEDEQEKVLAQAYELGRAAIMNEWGVLDIAQVHQESLKKLLGPPARANGGARIMDAAKTFLLESLSPFEAEHRGFREMNVKLQERNRALEKEIRQRKRVEDALRQSEKHYRRLFNEAQAMQENLRSLSDKILRAQEEERKRISRELHDEVGQSLTAISVILASLRNEGAPENGDQRKKLTETQSLLQGTMETVHGFARDLRPSMLDELGLLPALRSYLKSFAVRSGLQVCLRGNPIAEKLDNDQKTVLFRVAQECLTNVSKHAQASQVEVAVRKFNNGVCMEVADNGKSFNDNMMSISKNKGRLGLLGMHERVRLVNGRFAVIAKPGSGTTIRVVLPFHATRAAMVSPRVLQRLNDKSPPNILTVTRSYYAKNQSSNC